MATDLVTHCDKCGKEIRVVKEMQEGRLLYLVHGLFCINIPAFFCEKDCFQETIKTIKKFEYLDEDEKGKPVVDVDVMIDETLVLDKMYDIVYAVDNPMFPTLVFQRLLEVDGENPRFLYALSSLYIGLLAAEKTPRELKDKVRERLGETEEDLRKLSPAGYKKLSELREHYRV